MLYISFNLFYFFFFFFNDTATTEIYTLSLHDALPIFAPSCRRSRSAAGCRVTRLSRFASRFARDRKSTRLNSSHSQISYAVFCLKKKKRHHYTTSAVYSGIRRDCSATTSARPTATVLV